jgi:hypothetical protein
VFYTLKGSPVRMYNSGQAGKDRGEDSNLS